MYDTELHFLSRTEMHSDDKWYVEKYKVYFNLIWLLAEVGGGGGDVMGGAGYAPTVAAARRLRGSVEGRAGRALGVHRADAGDRGVQPGCTQAGCRRSEANDEPAFAAEGGYGEARPRRSARSFHASEGGEA